MIPLHVRQLKTTLNPSSNVSDVPVQRAKVAVIGGGRWGRIICRVLHQLDAKVSQIHWVSQRNHQNAQAWIEESFPARATPPGISLQLWDSWETMLEQIQPEIAIIANMPSEHYPLAKQLLQRDIHVLVEKPLAPRSEQVEELLNLAKQRNLVLGVGLEYTMASYLYYFKQLMLEHMSEAHRVIFHWHDQAQEQKWDTLKLPDMTTNVANDIIPHILSMLSVWFDMQEVEIGDLQIAQGGDSVEMKIQYGSVPVQLSITRRAEQSCRKVEVFDSSGQRLCLDFTKEPGTIMWNSQELAPDPHWSTALRPLSAELALFCEEVREREGKLPFLAQNARPIIEATIEANRRTIQAQKRLIRSFLQKTPPLEAPEEVIIALREHLILPFLKKNLITSPKDTAAINHMTAIAFRIIHLLSFNPFISQKEILDAIPLNKEELIALNRALRSADFAQNLITAQGQGHKYWMNTILPLIQSGATEATRKGEYYYPHRVGIYPGVSCMFHCSFCGRNPEAKYPRESIVSGNEFFKELFRSAPKYDPYRFYISGGLEPLTNVGIGEVITAGAREGFRLSMYTNAFMLTPQLLQKQPGIWDLATLRVSMYGVDSVTTTAVTQKKNSFEQVVKNIKAFLKLRNERASELKIGLNFVLLPGKAEQVLDLLEVMAEINREAGGRQIDFLTLREDYSVDEDEAISQSEREKLIAIFARLEKRRREADLCELQIDYGYALAPMQYGALGKPLQMVQSAQLRPRVYPQVSVVTDLLKDIYLYREAGFLDREGADRYIMGRVNEDQPFAEVIRRFIEDQKEVLPQEGDTKYLDIFDHVVTKLLNQMDADQAIGIPCAQGPVRAKVYYPVTLTDGPRAILAHPTILPASE